MKKLAIGLMIATILSKILGFLRDLVLSYFYGAGNISDAYLIAMTIPTTVFAFIGAAIATSYIPMYNTIKNESGVNIADKFSSSVITLIIAIATVVVGISLIFTEEIVKVFALGFEEKTLKLTVDFTRIMIFGVYFTGIVNVLTAYLNIKNKFLIPGLVAIPMNICIIISIIVSYKTSNIILAIGMVIATGIQVIFLYPFVRKQGFRYNFTLKRNNKYIKRMLYLALPVMLGVCVNQINILVDRTIASTVAVGGVSALNYANKLNNFVFGLFVVSIVTVLYPMIAKMATENNIIGVKKALTESITSINLLVVPATVGAMVFSEPIVRLLFGRGAFDENAIEMTSAALFFYSISMISMGLREVLAKTFYSLQDTKTPMINSTMAVVTNIILNIVLSKYMGISGLALATSISVTICTVLLIFSLRRKIGSFQMKELSKSFVKIGIASIIMGIGAKSIYTYSQNMFSNNVALILSIICAAIVYFIIILFMKIDEVDTLINKVKNKILKKTA